MMRNWLPAKTTSPRRDGFLEGLASWALVMTAGFALLAAGPLIHTATDAESSPVDAFTELYFADPGRPSTDGPLAFTVRNHSRDERTYSFRVECTGGTVSPCGDEGMVTVAPAGQATRQLRPVPSRQGRVGRIEVTLTDASEGAQGGGSLRVTRTVPSSRP